MTGFSLVLLSAGKIPQKRITTASQTHPDKKRIVEIQQALIDKGYMFGLPTGVWDNKTIETLKNIANDHGWQTSHVPDARVLILLDLGNKYSDPEVLKAPKNRLDPPYKLVDP